MHSELCEVSDITARKIAETKIGGGRVIAVGTTTRTLESFAMHYGEVVRDVGHDFSSHPVSTSGHRCLYNQLPFA